MEEQTNEVELGNEKAGIADSKKNEKTVSKEKTIIPEPEMSEMSLVQKIILCLMSVGLLFVAVSIHEFVPLIGFFAYFIYPITVANLTYRYGYIMSLGAMVIAHCFIGIVWNPYVARAAIFGEGVIGLLFGFCFRRGYSGKRTFFTVAGIFTGAVLLLQLLPLSSSGVLGAIVEESYMRTVFARKLVGSLEAAFVADSFMMSSEIPTGLVLAVLRSMIPAIFIFQQAFLIWLYYLAIGFAMKEMGRSVAAMPALSTWQVPRWLFWTALAVAVIDGFVPFRAGGFSFLCMNIAVCSVLFFMVCGISIFWHYLRFSQVSWLLKVVAVVVVIYFLSYGLGAAMLTGALDAIFDFRKLKKQGEGVPAVSAGEAAVAWEQAEFEKAITEKTSEEAVIAGEVSGMIAEKNETKEAKEEAENQQDEKE